MFTFGRVTVVAVMYEQMYSKCFLGLSVVISVGGYSSRAIYFANDLQTGFTLVIDIFLPFV